MKKSITKIVIAIVILFSTVSVGSPDMSGQYWFGSLSVNADGSEPWGKRGIVSIAGNQWYQQWEDYDGPHELSSAFTTTTQPDWSINIKFTDDVNFPVEPYNVAFNGDVMIHAGTVLGGGGEGIDIFTRKAINPDVNDILGDHSFLGHFLGQNDDTTLWGNFRFDPNGTFTPSWTNDSGRTNSYKLSWTLDDVNSIIDVIAPMGDTFGDVEFFLSKGDIGSTHHITFEEGRDGNDLGYNIFIKKTGQAITTADIAGTYQVRFLQTGPGGVPYTCGQGTCVIEPVDEVDATILLDAWYSNGEHSVKSRDCSVGPGNEFHLDDDGVPDGIVSPDKKLILAAEYRYQNPPTRTEDDWIGGIFLIRMPDSFADLNGDGIVDSADMLIMFEHYGTDNQLCDIAPVPWGDGIVDVQDLTVLTAHLNKVYPPAVTVEVNEDNNDGQIELERGQVLVVTLASNPSTGYRWEPEKNKKPVLLQLGKPEFKQSEITDPPMVGAGGREIFRFRAVSEGQMTLELIYHRAWEDAEPLKTFSIQVTVN